MSIFKSKRRIIISIVTALCIFLIAYSSTGRNDSFISNTLGFVVIPIQTGMNSIGDWFSNISYRFGNTNALLLENQRLNDELTEIYIRLSRLELLESEIEELLELLQMKNRFTNFSMIAASVVSRDNNNWNSRFNINIGTSRGVDENTVVVAQEGLVGQVSFAASNFAIVKPIIDDSSRVGAMVARNHVAGLAIGDLILGNEGLLTFEAPAGSDIVVGDEIVTSAFGVIFPAGLTIGTVTEILGTTQQNIIAVVETHVNFNNLNSVMLIIDVVD